ncbi:hypothetical protein J3R82DRAFT_10916 [Butyriboletus roseoflavus]|nr:hypothetical protein J3R82DRAFT_10916 [Butyriboletus roseoflavus]
MYQSPRSTARLLSSQGTTAKQYTGPNTQLTPAQALNHRLSRGKRSVTPESAHPGALTPFNISVALSRCRGRDTIRLLRDFDDKLLTSHPSEYLRTEDERLQRHGKVVERFTRI